mgnify:CR=1 FL=1
MLGSTHQLRTTMLSAFLVRFTSPVLEPFRAQRQNALPQSCHTRARAAKTARLIALTHRGFTVSSMPPCNRPQRTSPHTHIGVNFSMFMTTLLRQNLIDDRYTQRPHEPSQSETCAAMQRVPTNIPDTHEVHAPGSSAATRAYLSAIAGSKLSPALRTSTRISRPWPSAALRISTRMRT